MNTSRCFYAISAYCRHRKFIPIFSCEQLYLPPTAIQIINYNLDNSRSSCDRMLMLTYKTWQLIIALPIEFRHFFCVFSVRSFVIITILAIVNMWYLHRQDDKTVHPLVCFFIGWTDCGDHCETLDESFHVSCCVSWKYSRLYHRHRWWWYACDSWTKYNQKQKKDETCLQLSHFLIISVCWKLDMSKPFEDYRFDSVSISLPLSRSLSASVLLIVSAETMYLCIQMSMLIGKSTEV